MPWIRPALGTSSYSVSTVPPFFLSTVRVWTWRYSTFDNVDSLATCASSIKFLQSSALPSVILPCQWTLLARLRSEKPRSPEAQKIYLRIFGCARDTSDRRARLDRGRKRKLQVLVDESTMAFPDCKGGCAYPQHNGRIWLNDHIVQDIILEITSPFCCT